MRVPRTILRFAAAVAISCTLFNHSVEAVPLSGEITFIGESTTNSTSLRTATSLTQFITSRTQTTMSVAGGLSVDSAIGSFSSIPIGSFAAFTAPFVFNPSSAYPNFWQVSGFNFNLLSSTVFTQTSTFLLVRGTGIFTGNGFDPTAGTWLLARSVLDEPNTTAFTFTPAALPDAGSALLYLGTALTCLEALRRKLTMNAGS